MKLYLHTAPTEEPLTVDEVKAHLRVSYVEEDNYIANLIRAAREWGEAFTGRALVTQKWTGKLAVFPDAGIELPKPPTSAIDSVKYLDTAGVEQTWSSSEYLVTGLASESGRARIEPGYGYTWPSSRLERDAVRVLFTCGFGTAAQLPKGLKAALLIHVAEGFRNREHPNFAEAERAIWPWVETRFD